MTNTYHASNPLVGGPDHFGRISVMPNLFIKTGFCTDPLPSQPRNLLSKGSCCKTHSTHILVQSPHSTCAIHPFVRSGFMVKVHSIQQQILVMWKSYGILVLYHAKWIKWGQIKIAKVDVSEASQRGRCKFVFGNCLNCSLFKSNKLSNLFLFLYPFLKKV